MGCCGSRPSDDSTPAVRAHSSSHNITAPSTRPSSIPSLRGSQASQSNVQASQSRPDGDDRPNTPLKPIHAAQRSRLPNTLASPSARHVKPLTDSTNVTWTRSRLEKERQDWWDTQVTGSQEIWGAIRLAAQYLQLGELQEAQTMLDVTGCTCPTGLMWRGVYDPTGIQYKVPEWVVVEPDGLAEEDEAPGEAATNPAGAYAPVDGAQESDQGDEDDSVLVRARASHNQRDIMISVRRKQPVASIIERLKKQAEVRKRDSLLAFQIFFFYAVHQTCDIP
ncbi:hypothetical protein N0V83_007064 [Neocucurbitaria cava]|uniref:DC-UbP/UBTD2 N-terminal domain-containing protein n=1 Tax=Neocucurbitaria cava TaxID=798079 RepID=A0A9W8Y4T5_9PLEO|nr:hypothetical protein N0V83_007064 [Neocucurbitaria cava]